MLYISKGTKPNRISENISVITGQCTEEFGVEVERSFHLHPRTSWPQFFPLPLDSLQNFSESHYVFGVLGSKPWFPLLI